jgi:hypothetical protein
MSCPLRGRVSGASHALHKLAKTGASICWSTLAPGECYLRACMSLPRRRDRPRLRRPRRISTNNLCSSTLTPPMTTLWAGCFRQGANVNASCLDFGLQLGNTPQPLKASKSLVFVALLCRRTRMIQSDQIPRSSCICTKKGSRTMCISGYSGMHRPDTCLAMLLRATSRWAQAGPCQLRRCYPSSAIPSSRSYIRSESLYGTFSPLLQPGRRM